jgi:hypothetical protein
VFVLGIWLLWHQSNAVIRFEMRRHVVFVHLLRGKNINKVTTFNFEFSSTGFAWRSSASTCSAATESRKRGNKF